MHGCVRTGQEQLYLPAKANISNARYKLIRDENEPFFLFFWLSLVSGSRLQRTDAWLVGGPAELGNGVAFGMGVQGAPRRVVCHSDGHSS